MNSPKAEKLARSAVIAASWYTLAAAALLLVANAWLMLRAGGVIKLTPLQMLELPIETLKNPLNPAEAFQPYTPILELPLRASALTAAVLFTWITLLRHGYANPINAMRSEYELPLSRHLKPKLRDLGLWVPHDAARNDPKATTSDKAAVKLMRTFRPHADLARALTRRSNGILVPYDGPQPAARILLGNYRHLHLIRRKKYNVYARPEQHVVIFGPSGAGKGATQMVPSLLFWNGENDSSPDGHGKGWPGAIITSTVKSDHVDAALEWRQSISSECYIYDPLQSYPEFRDYWVGWDPLVTISNFSEANAVAAALMESESQQAGGGGGNEEYFKAQALMVLSPMLLSAALRKLPFKSVYDWALKLENEAADPAVISPEGDVAPDSRTYAVMDPLYDYADNTGDDTPLNQMQQIFAKDPREASGVWGTIRKILQPYNDEKSVMSTDPAAMPRMLNPKTFYTTPHATLFIIAPEVANEAKRMRPVFAAFITWLIEEAQKLARENNGKLPRPVLANLDEVKNVGAIPGLAHTLSLTRSIGFFVKHAWQDEAQIASAYGKDDAKTITSNSRTWVVLPGISDPEHLEALSRLIGERPVKKRKTKVDPENPDENSRMRAATASMVKELKDNELLILTDNLPPFVINASRYFQDKVMLARHKLGDARRDGEPIVCKPLEPKPAPIVHTGQKTDTLPALNGPVLATATQAQAEGANPAEVHEAPNQAPPGLQPLPARPGALAGTPGQAAPRPQLDHLLTQQDTAGTTPPPATLESTNSPPFGQEKHQADPGAPAHQAQTHSATQQQTADWPKSSHTEPPVPPRTWTPRTLGDLGVASNTPPLPGDTSREPERAANDDPATQGSSAVTTNAPATLFGAPLTGPVHTPDNHDSNLGDTNNRGAREIPTEQPAMENQHAADPAPATLGDLFGNPGAANNPTTQRLESSDHDVELSPQNTCTHCGTTFNLQGLDQQQQQAVWERHKKALHGRHGGGTGVQAEQSSRSENNQNASHENTTAVPEHAEQEAAPRKEPDIETSGWRTPEP